MPPKKAAQRKKTIASAAKRKKQKQEEEDDALLDNLLTKQETGGMDLIIDEVCATDLRHPDDYIYGNTSDEEEARRLAKAAEFQRAAEPLIAILSEEKVKKPGRFSANATAAFDQAKDLLAKTLLALAGKDVPRSTNLAPWSNTTDSTSLVNVSTNTIKMELESAGIGDPPNMKNLTQKLRFAAASSIYKLLKQRPKRDERNAEIIHYFTRVLTLLVIPSRCIFRLLHQICQEEGNNHGARELLQTAIELATEEEKSALVQQLEDFDQSVKHVSTQMGEKELACPICLSDCISPCRSTECVHIGCQQCLAVYLSTHKHGTCCCPICRKPFKHTVVVEPVQQKLYYLDRLDRNLDDVVAWYNLSHTERAFAAEDLERNAFQHALSKTSALPPFLPEVNSRALFSAEVLTRDPQFFPTHTWTNFAAGLLDLIEPLPLSSRRAFLFPLGDKLGDMTPLQAVARAISNCQSSEGQIPQFSNICVGAPWNVALRLMCRDYAEEVAKGSFYIDTGSRVWTPLDLVKIIIDQYLRNSPRLCMTQCIYILYLTNNMQMAMALEVRVEDEKQPKIINGCPAFVFFCSVLAYRSTLMCFEYMYLAIAWRGLKPSQRNTIQETVNVSQEALWASAIKLSVDEPILAAEVAEAMLPEEKELVDKHVANAV